MIYLLKCVISLLWGSACVFTVCHEIICSNQIVTKYFTENCWSVNNTYTVIYIVTSDITHYPFIYDFSLISFFNIPKIFNIGNEYQVNVKKYLTNSKLILKFIVSLHIHTNTKLFRSFCFKF